MDVQGGAPVAGRRGRRSVVMIVVAAVLVITAVATAVVLHDRSDPDRASGPGTATSTTLPATTGDLAATSGPPPGSSPSPPQDPETPAPGALGAGDRLFPRLGNGGYQVEHYDLDLRYPTADPTKPLTGSVTATAVTSRALSSFALDFAGGAVGSVTVDRAPATFRRDGEDLVITPAVPLPRGRRFVVTVKDFVSVAPSATDALEAGLLTTADGIVWMGQPANAHRIFPGNDHPGDLATYSFAIDVPAGTTAVANGVPKGSTSAGGRVVWRYEQAQPMAAELAQVACGRFTVTRRTTSGGVLVRDVTPTRLTDRLAPLLAAEVEHLDWMRGKVGDYPFGTFGSLVADGGFGFGGLETQTLILYPTGAVDSSSRGRAAVMVHELAHQWFGDSVAPATWSDLWLNEGHATWYEQLWEAEHDGDREASLADAMHHAYAMAPQWIQKSGPVAAPRSGDTRRLFSPTVYSGGALVLYALRSKIGAAAFERLERDWVSTYRGRAASTQDFVALASTVSGQDLGPFLHDWLYGETLPPMPGHPDWSVQPAAT